MAAKLLFSAGRGEESTPASPILSSRESNLPSERRMSNLGSTFIHTSQLDLSSKALSSHSNAFSLSSRPMYTSAIQYEGTYRVLERSRRLCKIFCASALFPADAWA